MTEVDPRRGFPENFKSYFSGGPDFDLSLELGRAGNDHHAHTALSRLWMCPNVDGPFLESLVPRGPECQFGILQIAEAALKLPFLLYWIREQSASEEGLRSKIRFGIQTQEPSDWLTLGIPVRALRAHWSVDDSWRVATQPWLSELCAALAEVANHIYSDARLALGVMGEETSGCWRSPTALRAKEAHQEYPPLALLNAEVIENRGAFVVPPDLWAKLAPHTEPVVLSSGLLYVPPHPCSALTGA
jgi:hypothetical protein